MRMRRLIVQAAVLFWMTITVAGGGELTRRDVIYLINQEKNFTGVDLSGIDLSGLDLSGANFSGSNLSRTSLVGALLQSADFSEANLEFADFADAELWGANFKEALNLSKARFTGARYNTRTTKFPPGFSPIPYGAFIIK